MKQTGSTLRRRPRAVGVILLSVLIAACGDEQAPQLSESTTPTNASASQSSTSIEQVDVGPSVQPCNEVWRDGVNIADIDGRAGCIQDGELTHYGTGGQLCDDGSNVGFNAIAWWGARRSDSPARGGPDSRAAVGHSGCLLGGPTVALRSVFAPAAVSLARTEPAVLRTTTRAIFAASPLLSGVRSSNLPMRSRPPALKAGVDPTEASRRASDQGLRALPEARAVAHTGTSMARQLVLGRPPKQHLPW